MSSYSIVGFNHLALNFSNMKFDVLFCLSKTHPFFYNKVGEYIKNYYKNRKEPSLLIGYSCMEIALQMEYCYQPSTVCLPIINNESIMLYDAKYVFTSVKNLIITDAQEDEKYWPNIFPNVKSLTVFAKNINFAQISQLLKIETLELMAPIAQPPSSILIDFLFNKLKTLIISIYAENDYCYLATNCFYKFESIKYLQFKNIDNMSIANYNQLLYKLPFGNFKYIINSMDSYVISTLQVVNFKSLKLTNSHATFQIVNDDNIDEIEILASCSLYKINLILQNIELLKKIHFILDNIKCTNKYIFNTNLFKNITYITITNSSVTSTFITSLIKMNNIMYVNIYNSSIILKKNETFLSLTKQYMNISFFNCKPSTICAT
ncbi:putative surface protein [Glossina pallidipes salivary gland hypertrophy virus]|uniref:Putative surface protein n=1 Tax=Glossina hytrovirus (isolate Glossina pallidipes/Ethiopia/Seibersdorf/-) TaxID=379529 RepID=A0A109QSV5_GHVS|nr:putative surface protein [Glossina pallidipes salivary gland hypertrophy virus]